MKLMSLSPDITRNNEPEQLIRIALRYGLNNRGFETQKGLRIFLYTTASRPALGPTQPPI